jgi:hypothetical protein
MHPYESAISASRSRETAETEIYRGCNMYVYPINVHPVEIISLNIDI